MKREELAEWIAHPVYSPRIKRHGVPMEDALRSVDEYAHELAEKIRAAEWAEPCSEGCCNGDGPEAIADFIDPEVSSNG